MSHNCEKLNRQDLDNALAALDDEDRQRIKTMAARLEERIKQKSYNHIGFGELSGLELIARVGIFYIRRNIKINLPMD